jgi:pyruvate dehydrogenase E2 component (dihydrolipoamide acetyltransferase)
MDTIEVRIPAIGDFKDVPIIEVLVKPGDAVEPEQSLVTLESEKATMDVPSPAKGKVRDLKVKVGDRVSEGMVVLTLDADGARAAAPAPATPAPAAPAPAAPAPAAVAQAAPEKPVASKPAAPPRVEEPATPAPAPQAAARSPIEIRVPQMGGFKDIPIIDVLVKAGDKVQPEQSLVTLESEKATMDVPSPAAGTVRDVRIKMGDRVSEGSVLLVLDASGLPAPKPAPAPQAPAAREAPAERGPQQVAREAPAAAPAPARAPGEEGRAVAHASPSVRKFARELGVDLARVEGTGPKGRIVRANVERVVKETMQGTAGAVARGGVGLDLPPWPRVDFAKYGPIEAHPLSRIRKLSAANLSRNWVMIPHVTQHDEADVTELEKFRQELNAEHAQDGVKVTLLAFLVKACIAALRRFPEVNASLDGDQLVLKRYFHIGFAADTPNGLVVPVIKNADQKGVLELAHETADLAAKARAGKLALGDMQGGTFSISSLGGIGGTGFTPIINAPEVAILGVSRSVTKPVWDGQAFAPRLVLPLSLSYDHRVVDGALAARFTSFLAKLLVDMRRAML